MDKKLEDQKTHPFVAALYAAEKQRSDYEKERQMKRAQREKKRLEDKKEKLSVTIGRVQRLKTEEVALEKKKEKLELYIAGANLRLKHAKEVRSGWELRHKKELSALEAAQDKAKETREREEFYELLFEQAADRVAEDRRGVAVAKRNAKAGTDNNA